MTGLSVIAPLVGASLFGLAVAAPAPQIRAAVSVQACSLINPFCTPAGLKIDYYQNPNCGAGWPAGQTPGGYYITQNLSPIESSITNETFFPQDDWPTNEKPTYTCPGYAAQPMYSDWVRNTNGGITVNANAFTLVYSGFFKAPATGTYTVCSSVDNINEVFLGDGDAFSCATGKAPASGATPILTATNTAPFVNPSFCADVALTAALYYPIRSVMSDNGGPSAFNLTIAGPGLAATHELGGYVYPLSCLLGV